MLKEEWLSNFNFNIDFLLLLILDFVQKIVIDI